LRRNPGPAGQCSSRRRGGVTVTVVHRDSDGLGWDTAGFAAARGLLAELRSVVPYAGRRI
jgi:hypothetical protein